jgi:hypothetical protein
MAIKRYLREKKQKEENKKKYDALISEANTLFNQGKYEEAKSKIAEAKRLLPDGGKHDALAQKVDAAIEKKKQDEDNKKAKDEADKKAKEEVDKKAAEQKQKDEEEKDGDREEKSAGEDSEDGGGSESDSGGIGGSATPVYGSDGKTYYQADPITGERRYFKTAQERDTWAKQRMVQSQSEQLKQQEQKKADAEAARKAEETRKAAEQQKYEKWRADRQQELDRAANQVAAQTIGVFVVLGGFMYQGMGNVNPDYVYTDFGSSWKSFKFFTGMDFGFSASTIPMLYKSQINTMINGENVEKIRLKPANPFTLNIDYTYRLGLENNYLGGYGFYKLKAGLNPFFEGFQFSPLNGGINLYAGIKWVKLFGEWEWGKNRYWYDPWTKVEESGGGDLKTGFSRFTWGLKFTTNQDRDYKRNHILIGIIRENTTNKHPYGGYLPDNITNDTPGDGIVKGITGYTFRWKRDHTFNLYVNLYPKYGYTGHFMDDPSLLIDNDDLGKTQKGGLFLEFGFVRSLDWYFGNANIETIKDNVRHDRKHDFDGGFVNYTADKQNYFGLSSGMLNSRKMGWFFALRSNLGWFSEPLTEKETGGKIIWENMSDEKYYLVNVHKAKETRNGGSFHVTGGITKHILYPLWLYAGAGFGSTNILQDYSASRDSEGYYWRNVDTNEGKYLSEETFGTLSRTVWRPNIEGGILIPLRPICLQLGIRTDFKTPYVVAGIGLAL